MIPKRRRNGFCFWILKYLDASRALWTFCQHHAVSSALPLPLHSNYKFQPFTWCQKRPFHVLRYIIIYIFAYLHRNSIQLSIPYPRPISLDSNVKGAFDVNHHSDNWPNCNGHYWNCNYPWPWCGNQTVSIISFLLFLFFSQRNFPERIGQNFPSDLFPTKTIFKRKLRRQIFEGVEGWTVAPFGTEDWKSFSLGILNGHNINTGCWYQG